MKKENIIIELIGVNKMFDDTYAVENFNLYVNICKDLYIRLL